jgi:hypothetical protein
VRRGTATFDKAYKAFERVTKAQGGDAQASWKKVVDALDGKKAENGRLLVGYGDLSGPEKGIFTVTKAIFKQAKREAVEAGVFTGQSISSYWPHMNEGAKIERDAIIKRHAEWLQNTPEGKERSEAKREGRHLAQGIVGDEPPSRSSRR